MAQSPSSESRWPRASRLTELLIVAALAATGPVIAAVTWVRSEVNKRIEAEKKEVQDQIRAVLPPEAIIFVRTPDCPSGWVRISVFGGLATRGGSDTPLGTPCSAVPRLTNTEPRPDPTKNPRPDGK
jgi:hypothetical protein